NSSGPLPLLNDLNPDLLLLSVALREDPARGTQAPPTPASRELSKHAYITMGEPVPSAAICCHPSIPLPCAPGATLFSVSPVERVRTGAAVQVWNGSRRAVADAGPEASP
ncbi:hypothetical protein KUCAC02_032664, partial [Chaenocephalus aceratus]